MSNEVFKLRIAYKNGNVDLINDVSNYELLSNHKVFYFEKNGMRTFIPVDVVMYFGRYIDHAL